MRLKILREMAMGRGIIKLKEIFLYINIIKVVLTCALMAHATYVINR